MIRSLFLVLTATFILAHCSKGPSAFPDKVENWSYQTAAPENYNIQAIRNKGAGKWRVVLVPGTPSVLGPWSEMLSLLPQSLEAIAIHRPGFGDSEPEEGLLTFEEQMVAIEPLLNIEDGRKIILVGHSLGGPLITFAADKYGDKIAGLVVLAGSFDPDLEEIHPLQNVGRWWGIRHILPDSLNITNLELFAHKKELRALSPKLGTIKQPVIMVHGTEDGLVPYENSLYLRDHLTVAPLKKIITIEGADHLLDVNNPQDVAAAILEMADYLENNS